MDENALWRVECVDFRQGIYEIEDEFIVITDPLTISIMNIMIIMTI